MTCSTQHSLPYRFYMQLHSPEVLFFIKVSGFTTFSEAADHLNVPQPTVSRRIIGLEKTLGQPLFVRARSGLTLTPFGQNFLTNALRVEAELENLKYLALKQDDKKVVSVEAPPVLANHLINKVLPSFYRLHPTILVDVQLISYKQQYSNNQNAIRLQAVQFEPDTNSYIKYLDAHRSYYAHPDLVLRYPELKHPLDLERYNIPCIVIGSQQEHADKWLFNENQRSFSVNINPVLRVNDGLSAKQGVLNDLGVAWNYDVAMSDAIEKGQTVELFSSSYTSGASAFIGYSRNKNLTKPETIFIEFVQGFMSTDNRGNASNQPVFNSERNQLTGTF